ncbi:MAG: hypothetical protein AAGC78_11465, partial [Cellvibrio sp.]|uniref:hypothetical protein n=1 Tax=Cellvibrio sp. TaxID=1965322 RepID=UPI0031A73303
MDGSKIKINTTIILWGSVSVYVIIMLLGSIRAFKANYLECADVPDDLFRACLENSRAAYGQFGDFIGGMFNPIVGLFTIYLLVSTIKQQNRALEQTEAALGHANSALGQNERALEQNAEALIIARDEIRLARDEIAIGREIQLKTEQALDAQISEAKSQNNLSNYFTHRNQYIGYISVEFTEGEQRRGQFESRYLHGLVYSNAHHGRLNVGKQVQQKLVAEIREFIDAFSNINDNSDGERKVLLEVLKDQITRRRQFFRGYMNIDGNNFNRMSNVECRMSNVECRMSN